MAVQEVCRAKGPLTAENERLSKALAAAASDAAAARKRLQRATDCAAAFGAELEPLEIGEVRTNSGSRCRKDLTLQLQLEF